MRKLWLLLALLVGISPAVAQNAGWPPPAGAAATLCVYNATAPILTNGQVGFTQCDPNGFYLTTGHYTRPLIFSGNLTIAGTSYAVTQNIGGAGTPITLSTGLPSGTFVKLPHVQIIIAGATVSACGGFDATFFSSNPTGTTFSDNQATTIAVADIPKIATMYNLTCIVQASVGLGVSAPTNFVPNAIPVDANGNLYLAIQSAGVSTIGTPTKVYYTVELGL